MTAAAEFEGRVAFVTGGASGIGEAVVRRLASGGAAVAVADKDLAGAQAVAAAVSGGAVALALDVADPDAVTAAVAQVVARFGRLDLAVNNAGVGEAPAPVHARSDAAWRRVMSINLDGVFFCLRAEIAAMLAQARPGGAIVNMASVLGLNGFANSAAYVASKHAVIGLTKACALEYAAKGVRVNAVAPAFITTPALLNGMPDQLDALARQHPIGRLGTAAEVAELTAFLLSDRAAFVNGSCHLVDGGYDAQ